MREKIPVRYNSVQSVYTGVDFSFTPYRYNHICMTKNYIKEIRTAKKITQEELAARIGVEQATVQRHESGKRQLKWEQIQEYARALDCASIEITDGPGATTENDLEKDLLETFRGLSDGAKSMYLHTLKSFANAPEELPAQDKKGKKANEQ